jgi:hypothetical protein
MSLYITHQCEEQNVASMEGNGQSQVRLESENARCRCLIRGTRIGMYNDPFSSVRSSDITIPVD